jgi:transcription antitermination protein NusB
MSMMADRPESNHTTEETQETHLGESATDVLAYNDLSRRDVRALIFYLLYAAESFDYQESIESLVDNFNRGFDLDIPMKSEVVSVAQQIIDAKDQLDEQYKPLLSNWRFERIGVATKLILRFALWELKNSDTDPRIVINEAVELAKGFAEKDAYKFVNGILDKFVRKMEETKK